jgi:predicted oxidoreductase
MIEKILLAPGFSMSRIVHGHMRMGEWNMNSRELLTMLEQLVEQGITTFDHADIYGKYTCETLLGEVLKLQPGLRNDIEIVTKCGIRLITDKFPKQKIKYYDYSFNHIVDSVHNSLNNFGTDRIDLLLLHRPSPFFNPEEAARAFSVLKKEGKVLHFGVSNFTPRQFEMLNQYTEEPLVTNQVEISPVCLEHFANGNMDFFLKEKIKPMAWSPLAGGRMFHPTNEKAIRILRVLQEIAEELSVETIDEIIYAWLLVHPAMIIPVVGSGNPERIGYAVNALNVRMSTEQWLRIYNASTGTELP